MSNIQKLTKKYSKRDLNALRSIYTYRCLSYRQLFNMHYRYRKDGSEVTDGYFNKKMISFRRDDLIECVDDGKVEPVYFLTTNGVNLIKNYFNFPNNIYDSRKQLHRRGYLTSSELKVAPSFIAHQSHLNQFVIDLLQEFPNSFYDYKDEKHIDNFVGIRPDGILRLLGVDFFLEMDMGTEDKKQLANKWNNYRRFIKSNEFFFRENNIVVLFIVDGVSDITKRKDLIKRTILENMIDLVDKTIDIYVDTKDNLIEIVKERIIPNQFNECEARKLLLNILATRHNFAILEGDKVANLFDGELYDYFIIKKGDVVVDGKTQEYLVEDFRYEPMSVINKILYLKTKNVFFRRKFNRDISLIVVVEDEEYIYNQMKLFDSLDINNIYFTTVERLEKDPLNKALFNYNYVGQKHHYKDMSLTSIVLED